MLVALRRPAFLFATCYGNTVLFIDSVASFLSIRGLVTVARQLASDAARSSFCRFLSSVESGLESPVHRLDRMSNQSVTVGDELQGAAPAAGAGVVGLGAAASPCVQKAGVENEAGVDAVATGTAGRQLKELRSLMPWNWDARIEDHPPGEKAMVDFEDVVNYRYDGRRRARSVSAVEEVERFKKAEEARAEREKKRLARLERAAKKKEGGGDAACGEHKAGSGNDGAKEAPKAEQEAGQKAVTTKPAAKRASRSIKSTVVCGRQGGSRARANHDDNKENVPPMENILEGEYQADVSTAVTPSASKSRRNSPRSCNKDQAVTTPGFVLTPASGNTSSVSVRKRGKGNASSGGYNNSNKHSKRLTGGDPKPQNKSRRVTFGATAGAGAQLVPLRSDSKTGSAKSKKTPRAVNFPESLTIDLDKYGYGVGMRPPPGCPPLFHTAKDHGRTTVPAVSPIMELEMPALALNDATIPRACTPFRGRPVLSREFVLAQMVQAGIRAAAELERLVQVKVTANVQGNADAHAAGVTQGDASLPLELSPELGAALTMLSQIRTNL